MRKVIDLTPENNGGGGGSNNYVDLDNKPSINNVTLVGNKTLADLGITNSSFVYEQNEASSLWEINHNLNKKPSIMVVDSADNVVIGEEQYIDENNLIIEFKAEFKGKAYLN